MRDAASSLNDRIALRVRELRAERGLSLDALAGRCDVSRSMISLIERGESSPTAVVLERLAAGLDVAPASFFDDPAPVASPVARGADAELWCDPDSGYVRRSVSPSGVAAPFQIAEVAFPAGTRVAYESGARDSVVHQQVWVLEGTIEVTLGGERHRLETGDCLALVLDQPIVYHNATDEPARYAVVVATDPKRRTTR